MERILIISLGFGTGHNSAARALAYEMERKTNVRVEMVDLLEFIPKSFHPLLQSGYHRMLTKFPMFYHYLYDWTYQSRIIRRVSKEVIEKMGWTIRKKVNQLLNEIQPTKIVTTHPFSLLLLPPAFSDIPSIGVVTDYELHPIWLIRVPDVLCVPKRLLKRSQLERIQWQSGVRVVETGIPIHPKYYQEIPIKEARRQLSLDPDRPVILFMGGGMGLGPLEQLVEEVKRMEQYQFVVLTGKNGELYGRLAKRKFGPHIRIEGYRTDVDVFMSAADLLVTKPGGITVTEAIAKRLPMLLFEAFPGQEEANQQYLLHHRVAMETGPATICSQIEKFFSPAFTYRRMMYKDRFAPLTSPDSAKRIVQETLDLVSRKVYIL
jgi:processive 1,2-diacylglycerol beta-glucosyltransferase